METVVRRTPMLLIWIGLAVVGATLYGCINDQITATISPEYFTVFKQRQFAPVLERVGLMDAPIRIQALAVGTLSTWWYGLFLGIVLGISSTVGRYPLSSTRAYVRAVGGVMAAAFCTSVLFGAVAYVTEPLVKPDAVHWRFLTAIHDVRPAYAVGWWHTGAYLGALAATLLASFQAQRVRRIEACGAVAGQNTGTNAGDMSMHGEELP